MDNLSENAFRENLNTQFLVVGDTETAALELIECNDLGSSPNQEQFSILFRGPLQPSLQQMTYEMKHEKLGDIVIFLAPVKEEGAHTFYEAVFNRFIEPS